MVENIGNMNMTTCNDDMQIPQPTQIKMCETTGLSHSLEEALVVYLWTPVSFHRPRASMLSPLSICCVHIPIPFSLFL